MKQATLVEPTIAVTQRDRTAGAAPDATQDADVVEIQVQEELTDKPEI